jgi:hypothetical protein
MGINSAFKGLTKLLNRTCDVTVQSLTQNTATIVSSSDPQSGCTVKSRSLVACQGEGVGEQRLRHCRRKLLESFGEKNAKQDNRQAGDLLENTPYDSNCSISVKSQLIS